MDYEKKFYFEKALEIFMEKAQNIVDENMKRYPDQFTKLRIMKGRRYYKIVADSGMFEDVTQSSAWAFIDTTNGDILKPATWKAPAKHARGNIYDDEYTLTPWGPPYLK